MQWTSSDQNMRSGAEEPTAASSVAVNGSGDTVMVMVEPPKAPAAAHLRCDPTGVHLPAAEQDLERIGPGDVAALESRSARSPCPEPVQAASLQRSMMLVPS